MEQLNSEKQNQYEQMSEMNMVLQERFEKSSFEMESLKDEKVAMIQKLREVEWGKDQEIKSLGKALTKMKEEGDKMKVTTFQDIENIKDEVSARYKEELKAKN